MSYILQKLDRFLVWFDIAFIQYIFNRFADRHLKFLVQTESREKLLETVQ